MSEMSLVDAISRAMFQADAPEDYAAYDAGLTSKHSEYDDLAKAALAAIEEQGYVVVPKEPTGEMKEAGSLQEIGMGPKPVFTSPPGCSLIYKAMLSAAPEISDL